MPRSTIDCFIVNSPFPLNDPHGRMGSESFPTVTSCRSHRMEVRRGDFDPNHRAANSLHRKPIHIQSIFSAL